MKLADSTATHGTTVTTTGNNRLKLVARGRSTPESRLRSRTAA